jgi:TRAP-type mannitol/chloroaromatic compound transport system substrate-binding protein
MNRAGLGRQLKPAQTIYPQAIRYAGNQVHRQSLKHINRRQPMTDQLKPAPRRRFLKTAAAATAGAGAMAAPMIAVAQTATFRFQSTWPAKDIFHEYANDFAKKVNDMAGNRLKIEVLPSGSVVPAFQLLDAVNKGTLDGGHGVLAYHYGKSNALALWGSGPAFGMDPNMVLSWHYYGGGKALLEEIYKSLNIDVTSFVYGPMPTQPLGWFKKPIAKVDDIKGLKFRTVGLSIDVFKEMGAAVNPLPGGEIVPALDRGLLDAAEFNNASSDRILGFPDVVKNCMLQSFHQSGEQFEILFNKAKYDALPAELKSVIDYAVQAASADMSWKAIQRNSQDYIELKTKDKVNFYKTPDAILRAQLEAWDKVTSAKSAEQPLFKKVMDSQKEFAQRAGSWQNDYMVDFKMAWNHYFRAPKKT